MPYPPAAPTCWVIRYQRVPESAPTEVSQVETSLQWRLPWVRSPGCTELVKVEELGARGVPGWHGSDPLPRVGCLGARPCPSLSLATLLCPRVGGGVYWLHTGGSVSSVLSSVSAALNWVG